MTGDPPSIILVRDLTVGYGEKVVLQHLNFEVRSGEVFIILGGSGCGKSTLLKSLIGLNPPLAGEIWIQGENLVSARDDEGLLILRKFGVMYQSGALFGSMTVVDNVTLPLDEFTSVPDELKELVALAKLKLVGLEAAAQKLPSELSGGIQKRAAIARAMASDALLAIERHSGIKPVELHTIRRQDPSLARTSAERTRIQQYRKAVEAAAAGKLAESFNLLDKMGAVVECGLGE
jgi:phospholipid/cholesterol/gamma-HCH transport system ATP-binding protein